MLKLSCLGSLRKVQSTCLYVTQMTTLPLKERDIKRAVNPILHLDDSWAHGQTY